MGGNGSGGRAEQVDEQPGAFGGCAYLQVQVRAVEVEPEVEERAASLFGRSQLSDPPRPLGRQRQP